MQVYFRNIFILLILSVSGTLSAHHSHKSKCSSQKKYDYIIIGGGTAGCIEARKLSDDFTKSVLVIEAGGNYTNDPVVLNPDWTANADTLLINPKYSVTYPSAVAFLQTVLYSEGRGLGGGGTHNFLIAYRGTPSIYNQWAIITGRSPSDSIWGYDNNILSVMKSIETYTPTGTVANTAQRGTEGPISILQNPPIEPQPGDFLSELSVIAKAPFITDYNDPTLGDVGISAIQQFITPNPGSHRSFSANEYLNEVIDRNGKGLNGRQLQVLTNSTALKFDIDSKTKRATCVHYTSTPKNGKKDLKD